MEANLRGLDSKDIWIAEYLLANENNIVVHQHDMINGGDYCNVTDTDGRQLFELGMWPFRLSQERNILIEIDNSSQGDGLQFIRYKLNPSITYHSIANPDNKDEMEVLNELDLQCEKCLKMMEHAFGHADEQILMEEYKKLITLTRKRAAL